MILAWLLILTACSPTVETTRLQVSEVWSTDGAQFVAGETGPGTAEQFAVASPYPFQVGATYCVTIRSAQNNGLRTIVAVAPCPAR